MSRATHPYLDAPRPRVLAHRGLVTDDMRGAGVVENTVAAIAAAHAAGATYVESDCHRTADGEIVLFHDDSLERVIGDPRRISDVELRELEDLMAERGGLATLAHALDAFPTTRFNIDVKADDAPEQAGEIIAEHAERVLVTSFSDRRRARALAACRAAGGDPATSGGMSRIATIVARVRLAPSPGAARGAFAGLDALQIPERRGGIRVLTDRLIRFAHAAGVEIHVWTVDDEQEMRRLVERGVDGIVTDRADVALSLFEA